MRLPMKPLQFLFFSFFSQVAYCLGNFENVSNSKMENLVSNDLLGGFDYIFSGRSADSYQLVDGLIMSFPGGGDGKSSLVNFKISDPENNEEFVGGEFSEGRRKGGGGKSKKLLQRLLPLFIVPFLIQSAIVPVFLSVLKVMLMKSMMVGKLALILIAINALKSSNAFKSRSEAHIADVHYGYHGSGMEEYGAYIN